jgi:PAS domain S-box-containing protein
MYDRCPRLEVWLRPTSKIIYCRLTFSFIIIIMTIFDRVITYLNPIAHLGERRYSIIFSVVLTIFIWTLSEIFSVVIVGKPNIVESYVIYVSAFLVMYLAFRSGVAGAISSIAITVTYYVYIIITREYTGESFEGAIEVTVLLAIFFLMIGVTIGWLKQTIDRLIEQEANEKQRLLTIIQQLPVGVLITDKKGKIVQANRQVGKILGTKIPMGLTVGKDVILNIEKAEGFAHPPPSPLAQVLSNGKAIIDREITIIRPDGKRVYLQVSASAVTSRSGKVIAGAEILNDITAQKEIESRKDDFINMASHELKTPLTSMKLYIHSLRRHAYATGKAKPSAILANIEHQTERLQGLVNDLLDVSRLQTGKLSLQKEIFRLDELVGKSVEEMRETDSTRKIIYAKHERLSVYADTFRIHQVLTNLMTNALKYSPPESRIRLVVERRGKYGVVSVQDFGIGIAKSQQKKIFDRLYQVTDQPEKTFPGLGMGLYISKQIIDRHQGKIWVESEKGKGSIFYFQLPLYTKNEQRSRQDGKDE